jgi:hypothetical protein
MRGGRARPRGPRRAACPRHLQKNPPHDGGPTKPATALRVRRLAAIVSATLEEKTSEESLPRVIPPPHPGGESSAPLGVPGLPPWFPRSTPDRLPGACSSRVEGCRYCSFRMRTVSERTLPALSGATVDHTQPDVESRQLDVPIRSRVKTTIARLFGVQQVSGKAAKPRPNFARWPACAQQAPSSAAGRAAAAALRASLVARRPAGRFAASSTTTSEEPPTEQGGRRATNQAGRPPRRKAKI